jgi:hypothetical protein
VAGCGALSAVSGFPGSNHRRQRRKRSEVSAAGSAAVRPQPRGGRGGRTPTARTSAQLEPSSSVCPPTGPLARLLDTTADARPPQRSHCRWPLCGTCVGHPLSAARPADRSVSPAQRPADMTVEAAAEGPQRFRPGGGTGTGCRTPDRSGSPTLPWTPNPPAGRPGRTQDRTPEAADGQSTDRPARYNFLYSPSRPALRAAACGGRPRAGGHR